MSLTDVLANPPKQTRVGRSIIDDWADTLTETERDAVYKAAINPDWGHIALRDTLVKAGAPFVADSSLRTWRVKLGWRRES